MKTDYEPAEIIDDSSDEEEYIILIINIFIF